MEQTALRARKDQRVKTVRRDLKDKLGCKVRKGQLGLPELLDRKGRRVYQGRRVEEQAYFHRPMLLPQPLSVGPSAARAKKGWSSWRPAPPETPC